MQRQVYGQLARNAEEAKRRSAPPAVHSGFIWDDSGNQIGWIEDDKVFSVATKLQFATLDESGTLYSLNGQSLNLHLETVNGGGRVGAESNSSAIARLKELAAGSEDAR